MKKTGWWLGIFLGGMVANQTFAAGKNGALADWVRVDGVDTVLAEKHDTPLVTLNITFPVGSFADPAGKEGLSALFGDMLLRGTRSRTREQIENTLDFLGAALHVNTGYHSFSVEGQVLSRNFDKFLDLVIDILTEPTFSEEELKKLKEETIAQLYLRLEDDAQLARLQFLRSVYEGHPYSRDPSGTIASIRAITRDDVAGYYKAHANRGGMMVGGAGDLTRETFNAAVRRLAGKLPEGVTDKMETPFTGKLEGREVVLVDKPERTQTQFLIGHPGLPAKDKDFFPLNVFVTAFAGSMFQAKYMQEIRVKRGWSYGASGSVDSRRDGGTFFLYTFPKTADTLPAIKLSLELLQTAVDGGVTDKEIEFAKNYLARSYPFMIDVPEKVVSQRIGQKILGRSADYLEKYVSIIQAVTPDQARAAAKKYLSAKNVEIVILCTAKDFEKTIAKELSAKSVKIVPFDRL